MISLLLISGAGAHGSEEQDSRYMDGGFETRTEHMVVNGSLDVTDEGIVISLLMTPNEESMQMMEERKGDMGDDASGDSHGNAPEERDMGRFMGDMSSPSSFQNQMNVTLYAIVEFEETGTAGFDAQDTLVSIYYLNSSTLNPIETDDNGSYTVSSPDGVFRLDLGGNSSELGVLSWKWSVEINYPYVSNTSSVALLHDVQSMRGEMNMVGERSMMDKGGKGGSMGDRGEFRTEVLNNNTMMNYGEGAPMFLSWIETADVDGNSLPVVASAGDVFAIAIPHGSNIKYDPSIGVEASVVEDMDSSIALLGETETNTADFPYLALGFSVAILAVVVTRKRF